LWAGAEADAMGWGGIAAVARATGVRSALPWRWIRVMVAAARERLQSSGAEHAERIDTDQLEIEFAATLAKLNEISAQLPADVLEQLGSTDGTNKDKKKKRAPTGRRDLRDEDLPEERIVLVDPACEGTAEAIGAEETCQIMWRRGGPVRVVTVRTKYRSSAPTAPIDALSATEQTPPTIVTTPVPPQILTRSIATASLLAHIVSDKFCDGLPLHRQEDRFSRLGCRVDRGSMSRWIEDLGMIMGSSLVKAMRDDAFANAFCISTDATGVLVQPRTRLLVALPDQDVGSSDYNQGRGRTRRPRAHPSDLRARPSVAPSSACRD